jgi:hypothetical protein
MDNPVVGLPPEPERGSTFKVTVLVTLAIGVGMAALGIFHFRAPEPPPPEVIEKAPEVRYIEKPAPAPPEVPEPLPVPVPLFKPAPPPPPAPPIKLPPIGAAWEGVWRREEYPVPMFKFSQSGTLVEGTCVPNWGTSLPFSDGLAVDDTLEFVVDDRQVFRTHFKMTVAGKDRAKLEEWVTDEDLMMSLQRANKTARTPQQALVLRAIIEENSRKLRKPATVGIFTRQNNGG